MLVCSFCDTILSFLFLYHTLLSSPLFGLAFAKDDILYIKHLLVYISSWL